MGRTLPAIPEITVAVAALDKLGVVAGGSVGPPPPEKDALILVGTVGPGGAPDAAVINEMAEREAAANVVKLSRASADERHLFVWVPWSDTEGQAALSLSNPPETAPTLPSGVDVVWAGLWLPGPSVPTSVLWRVRPPSPWESVPIRYQALIV